MPANRAGETPFAGKPAPTARSGALRPVAYIMPSALGRKVEMLGM